MLIIGLSGTTKQLCSLVKLDPPQVHCLRFNDIPGEHTIYLASKDERIKIKHTVTSHDVFSDGALKVADWIIEQDNGLLYIKYILYQYNIFCRVQNHAAAAVIDVPI